MMTVSFNTEQGSYTFNVVTEELPDDFDSDFFEDITEEQVAADFNSAGDSAVYHGIHIELLSYDEGEFEDYGWDFCCM